MGLIKWLRREKIRRGARKEIKQAREAAPVTRQGQRALARKIEKITAENSGFYFGIVRKKGTKYDESYVISAYGRQNRRRNYRHS